ncbi:ABC transporter ATP-binding protein [uncultured Sphaerochaeta sp.]|uniref:ABC transporter ATP-binding protein n=1 Tax=uncultured Sphaerochaeta sp. TaxID=886478 RepID=UPI002AA856C7|nr:ABC transporter ATP-binding protein [uncultured Sphaerochaeta sp.]
MITVENLNFSYTAKPFIESMTFSVQPGEIFGFLGPSGAGKSTVQKILTGLIPSYKGNVVVNTVEPRRCGSAFYEHIGVDFEVPSLFEKLSGRENLSYFASLYKHTFPIEPLLESVGLAAEADKKVSAYSKGMKSRLNFIKALIHSPSILFLDEPTSGLDPSNARVMKDLILQQREKGTTILLTTHNMYDATELCDRVAFIVDGSIRSLDSPRNLIMSRGAVTVSYSYKEQGTEYQRCTQLSSIGEDTELLNALKENRLLSIHSSEPTLNDIFTELTGRKLQ